eukprot:2944756-Prorocentrum_lima.AAC.1
MTSSLVGSEMCIRDRLSYGAGCKRPPAAARGLHWFPGSQAIRGNQGAHDPVSYTHLTLPTICSV